MDPFRLMEAQSEILHQYSLSDFFNFVLYGVSVGLLHFNFIHMTSHTHFLACYALHYQLLRPNLFYSDIVKEHPVLVFLHMTFLTHNSDWQTLCGAIRRYSPKIQRTILVYQYFIIRKLLTFGIQYNPSSLNSGHMPLASCLRPICFPIKIWVTQIPYRLVNSV